MEKEIASDVKLEAKHILVECYADIRKNENKMCNWKRRWVSVILRFFWILIGESVAEHWLLRAILKVVQWVGKYERNEINEISIVEFPSVGFDSGNFSPIFNAKLNDVLLNKIFFYHRLIREINDNAMTHKTVNCRKVSRCAITNDKCHSCHYSEV